MTKTPMRIRVWPGSSRGQWAWEVTTPHGRQLHGQTDTSTLPFNRSEAERLALEWVAAHNGTLDDWE